LLDVAEAMDRPRLVDEPAWSAGKRRVVTERCLNPLLVGTWPSGLLG
jgi:hypothetical protein